MFHTTCKDLSQDFQLIINQQGYLAATAQLALLRLAGTLRGQHAGAPLSGGLEEAPPGGPVNPGCFPKIAGEWMFNDLYSPQLHGGVHGDTPSYPPPFFWDFRFEESSSAIGDPPVGNPQLPMAS